MGGRPLGPWTERSGKQKTRPREADGSGGPLAFWLGDLGPMLRARRAPPTRRAVVMQCMVVEGAVHGDGRLTGARAIRQFLSLIHI